MVKKVNDINGWVFIGVGFIVVAVSIFFYDTLKFFMIIGGIMTLYGLGKLAYDKVESQFKTNDKEWEPVDLNKTKNPYIEKMEQERKNAQGAQTITPQQRQTLVHPNTPRIQSAHPQHRTTAPMHATHQQRQHAYHPVQHTQQMQYHQAQAQHRQPAHNISGRYCGGCGSQVASHHRFCTQCGSRVS